MSSYVFVVRRHMSYVVVRLRRTSSWYIFVVVCRRTSSSYVSSSYVVHLVVSRRGTSSSSYVVTVFLITNLCCSCLLLSSSPAAAAAWRLPALRVATCTACCASDCPLAPDTYASSSSTSFDVYRINQINLIWPKQSQEKNRSSKNYNTGNTTNRCRHTKHNVHLSSRSYSKVLVSWKWNVFVDARFLQVGYIGYRKSKHWRTSTADHQQSPQGSSLDELQGTRPNVTDLRKNRPVEQQSKVVSVEVVVAVTAAAAVKIQQPNSVTSNNHWPVRHSRHSLHGNYYRLSKYNTQNWSKRIYGTTLILTFRIRIYILVYPSDCFHRLSDCLHFWSSVFRFYSYFFAQFSEAN